MAKQLLAKVKAYFNSDCAYPRCFDDTQL